MPLQNIKVKMFAVPLYLFKFPSANYSSTQNSYGTENMKYFDINEGERYLSGQC